MKLRCFRKKPADGIALLFNRFYCYQYIEKQSNIHLKYNCHICEQKIKCFDHIYHLDKCYHAKCFGKRSASSRKNMTIYVLGQTPKSFRLKI